MFRRVAASFLCVVLLIASFCVFTAASVDLSDMTDMAALAQEAEHARIYAQVGRIYRRTLAYTERESLLGYCGLMTSYQLWLLGVTAFPETLDGNGMFDYHRTFSTTSGGHAVHAYDAKDYSLEEALNLITQGGTRNAYNILVGFQSAESTAGAQYGHAVVIHAILDGVVYFVEGFYSSLGGPEGTVLRCSISEFAAYYMDWTEYEGAIDFGRKDASDFCLRYPTEMFIQALCASKLYIQPQEEDEAVLRNVARGERLHVTGIRDNGQDIYYSVSDGFETGYIRAEDARVLQIITDGVVSDICVTEQLQISGTVLCQNRELDSITLSLADKNGFVFWRFTLGESGCMGSAERFNALCDLRSLQEGRYYIKIVAKTRIYYVENGRVCSKMEELPLLWEQVCVGDPYPQSGAEAVRGEKDGWFYDGGVWYCYEDGQPRTGWYCYDGTDYYLQDDGSVTVGWAFINGRYRYFSQTGAMRTGWINTQAGRFYLLSNGAPVTGWRQIDGQMYCFSEEGVLRTEGKIIYNGVIYVFTESGKLVEWTQDMEESSQEDVDQTPDNDTGSEEPEGETDTGSEETPEKADGDPES